MVRHRLIVDTVEYLFLFQALANAAGTKANGQETKDPNFQKNRVAFYNIRRRAEKRDAPPPDNPVFFVIMQVCTRIDRFVFLFLRVKVFNMIPARLGIFFSILVGCLACNTLPLENIWSVSVE